MLYSPRDMMQVSIAQDSRRCLLFHLPRRTVLKENGSRSISARLRIPCRLSVSWQRFHDRFERIEANRSQELEGRGRHLVQLR